MYDKLLQPENAEFPMLVTLSGMSIINRKRESSNALSPMLTTLFGITTLEREQQPENAQISMLVTLSLEMVYFVNVSHWNIYSFLKA